MTREEAIQWIQLDIDMAKFDPTTGEDAYLNDDAKNVIEAQEMAISALKAQMDGDTISRQEAAGIVLFECGEFVGLAKTIIKRFEELPSAQPEPKWIPCSERLPEEHIGFYLVTVQKRRITALNVIGCDNTVHDIDIARWDYDRRAPQRGYHWCKADKVIAWMPLPEPYRQKEEP